MEIIKKVMTTIMTKLIIFFSIITMGMKCNNKSGDKNLVIAKTTLIELVNYSKGNERKISLQVPAIGRYSSFSDLCNEKKSDKGNIYLIKNDSTIKAEYHYSEASYVQLVVNYIDKNFLVASYDEHTFVIYSREYDNIFVLAKYPWFSSVSEKTIAAIFVCDNSLLPIFGIKNKSPILKKEDISEPLLELYDYSKAAKDSGNFGAFEVLLLSRTKVDVSKTKINYLNSLFKEIEKRQFKEGKRSSFGYAPLFFEYPIWTEYVQPFSLK
jgi:hypothetical protein